MSRFLFFKCCLYHSIRRLHWDRGTPGAHGTGLYRLKGPYKFDGAAELVLGCRYKFLARRHGSGGAFGKQMSRKSCGPRNHLAAYVVAAAKFFKRLFAMITAQFTLRHTPGLLVKFKSGLCGYSSWLAWRNGIVKLALIYSKACACIGAKAGPRRERIVAKG
jgi:hypothetical protein